MCDPNRLYEFYSELQRIHIQYFPNWRFGQFVLNIFGNENIDKMFYQEENEMLQKLREYVGEFNELS